MIVVDASIAAKWLLWEADTPRALGFLRTYGEDLHGPDLVFVEVAAVIVRRANIEKSIQSGALRALDKWTIAWADHVLRPHRVTQARLLAAGRLAIDLGHPLKDCIYLALAIELGCDLATADRRFAEKAAQRWPATRLLESYAGAG